MASSFVSLKQYLLLVSIVLFFSSSHRYIVLTFNFIGLVKC